MILEVNDVYVNSPDISPYFFSKIIASKKAYAPLSFFRSDFQSYQIDTIEEINLSFNIMDSESKDSILVSESVKITY